ncbi:MAG TPA: carboxypeptidase-like regulatory domain-containing protein [Dongiaceae bacterium]|nr:carboxypeptidase-like regulatory domain-containing protein [Dongiaceae bacterium]
MSATSNKNGATPHWHPGMLLKATRMLLLTLSAGALLWAAPGFAQSLESANTKSGSILGTVLDVTSDPVADATVVLQAPAENRLTTTTKDDGSFAVRDLTPGVPYQITVTAQGYADWNSSITVEPGQEKAINDVKLRILAVERAVTVTYSPKEAAAEQLKVEEKQRVLGFIPNIYVVYDPHPVPLTAKMKFHLAYKSMTHPTFFAFQSIWAGVLQAANTPDYQQGAKGYGERLGANLAGGAAEGLIGNALLPALLHQDPRYYYDGKGTNWSRARHAMSAPFVTKGDNGKWQPNYSQWGGTLIAAGLANTYYPESNRGVGLVFRNFGTNMALHVAGSLAQEFILGKFTSKSKN